MASWTQYPHFKLSSVKKFKTSWFQLICVGMNIKIYQIPQILQDQQDPIRMDQILFVLQYVQVELAQEKLEQLQNRSSYASEVCTINWKARAKAVKNIPSVNSKTGEKVLLQNSIQKSMGIEKTTGFPLKTRPLLVTRYMAQFITRTVFIKNFVNNERLLLRLLCFQLYIAISLGCECGNRIDGVFCCCRGYRTT